MRVEGLGFRVWGSEKGKSYPQEPPYVPTSVLAVGLMHYPIGVIREVTSKVCVERTDGGAAERVGDGTDEGPVLLQEPKCCKHLAPEGGGALWLARPRTCSATRGFSLQISTAPFVYSLQ